MSTKGISIRLFRALMAASCLLIAVSAFAAAECDPELTKVDFNFTAVRVGGKTPEEVKRIEDLRNRGASLCNSGLVQEGLAALNEAKALLGVD